jgi:hypothetical protein
MGWNCECKISVLSAYEDATLCKGSLDVIAQTPEMEDLGNVNETVTHSKNKRLVGQNQSLVMLKY